MAATEAEVQSAQQLPAVEDYHFTGNEVTVESKRVCLQGIRENHTITHGAYEAGVSRKCVHNWINTDPVFAEAVQEAMHEATERLETSMYKRAMEKDTIAGIFLLKKYNPEFRDKVTVDITEVQERINQILSRLEGVQQQQLPPAITTFIDTDYSQQSGEYTPANSTQISHLPESEQKD